MVTSRLLPPHFLYFDCILYPFLPLNILADDRAHGTNKFNDNVDSGSDNDEITEWSDNNRKQLPLLFRSGFFRYLNKDGVTVRAECLNCKLVYCGRAWSSSNFLKHLSVRFHIYLNLVVKVNKSHVLN